MKSSNSLLIRQSFLARAFLVLCLVVTNSVVVQGFFHHHMLGGARGATALTSSLLRRVSRPAILLSMTSSNSNSGAGSSSSSRIPSNQELVAQRLEVARAKKVAHRQAIQESQERNIKLKRLLHTNAGDATTTSSSQGGNQFSGVPSLYAIKVSVCREMRDQLKLSGREKRGRVFVEMGSDASQTLRGLKMEIHSFFRVLRKSSYLLEACLPKINHDGSVNPDADVWQDLENTWKIESDADVIKSFAAADEFFEIHQDKLKRPSLLLHVAKDPNAPPPLPTPTYLEDMPDPASTTSMTMLSFYAFPPDTILNPDDFALTLRKLWKPFHVLGRVYVAQEGVNAQMSVPTNVLSNFMACCRAIPELGTWMENGVNVDPKPLSVEEFATAGVPVNGKPAPPFRNLHVRVRNQVVADGLDKVLDWQSAGYDMPPLEWHAKLKEAREQQAAGNPTAPILLDCRNKYETDVGRFELAEPLGTENFRESWDVIKKRLADTPKDAPIMMYCTGGIRCVKVGAYVTQELGFTNVSRLAGGIIAYDRTLNEKAPDAEPLFKGTNFVFDGRLGRTITDDDFGNCITCGSETSLVSNCLNDNCHKRMIQCESCKTNFHGTCSDACKLRIVNGGMIPRKGLQAGDDSSSAAVSVTETIVFDSLEDYSAGHSSPPPSFYPEIEFNTKKFMPSGAHMVSGASQGRWLTQLVSMTREGRVLEIGTFTGYATACFWEGAANAGAAMGYQGIGGRNGGPYVMSLERDPRAIQIAVAHLKVMAENGVSEQGAEAACALRADGMDLPVVDDDIVTMTYNDVAGCEVVRVTDALATLEAMVAGTGDLQPAPFDMVFVDADKTRLLEYTEALINNDRILKKGGLIIVDNVLWKGLVLEASSGEFTPDPQDDDHDSDDSNADGASRRGRRARKLATKMHKFNREIVKDDRVEVMLLPMRDGLSVIRKR